LLTAAHLEKLEWPLLATKLALFAQTTEGQQACHLLLPNKSPPVIKQRWSEVISLRDIARSGYKAPIGELDSPSAIFKSAEKGQILEGTDFRKILGILTATKRVLGFAGSFAPRSELLRNLRGSLDPLSKLATSIENTVASDGTIKDDASPDLASLRQLKTNLRNRIEDVLGRILVSPDIADYLQDNFFTVRNEKYVIPVRLDGRGRIKGLIIDTSDSGQTLFLEPPAISQMNQDLHDIDVAEKLEIIRILRDLSAVVSKDIEIIRRNYNSLVDLDIKTAEASLAVEIDAGAVDVSEKPCLNLIGARHPLIKTRDGKTARPNTIALEECKEPSQRVLIVSGPNAGGKTVVLKTVGLLHLMARAGLLLPAEPTSKIYFFENIHLEMGDSQNITANLSTFSGHLVGLKNILESSTENDLVLLDELATGTEPQTGSSIARSILEHLAHESITAIATTHFDELKTLALEDSRFRNASMEYHVTTYRPTYKLILDVPGQSYGLELATQIGLPQHIIERASSLRGNGKTALDESISALQQARQHIEETRISLQKELLEAQAAKDRWNSECQLLEGQRAKVSAKLAAKIESDVEHLRSQFEDSSKELRDAVKTIRFGDSSPDVGYEKKRAAEAKLRDLEKTASALTPANPQGELPGQPLEASDLAVGLPVFVLPLKREGTIVKFGYSGSTPIDVQVGIIKLRVGLLDLRKTNGASNTTKKTANQTNHRQKPINPRTDDSIPEFVPQTNRNTIDLRGSDVDSAIDKALDFIDRCMRRDENFAVLIHGHGSDRLKQALRTMLKTQCPYNVSFRAGANNEGGDGVTIVKIG
jgi:DNA mismatch repair protein MutS2